MWSPSRQPRQRFACGPKNELGDLAQVLDGNGEAQFVTSAATTAEPQSVELQDPLEMPE